MALLCSDAEQSDVPCFVDLVHFQMFIFMPC